MEQIPIREFIQNHEIEEKIPYFGKARLYTIPIKMNTNNPESERETRSFVIPREIFHFVTSLYVLQPSIACSMKLKINSYEKIIYPEMYSEMSHDSAQRVNILQDPVFLGNHIQMILSITPHSTTTTTTTNENGNTDISIIHVLVEYSKILPSLFVEMHTNHTVLVSKQMEQDILIYRGNAP